MKRLPCLLLPIAIAAMPALAQENSPQAADSSVSSEIDDAENMQEAGISDQGMGDTDMEDQAALSPLPPPASDIETRDVDPALWVIRDADTSIYLFGTVHVLKPGLGWFDDAVKEAFDSSDSLIVEVAEPPAADMQAKFTQYALANDGIALRKRLKGKSLADYNAALKKSGFNPKIFDPLDPWAAAITLQLQGLSNSGYDPQSGVDTQLEAAAKASGKKIGQLETVDQQLGFFDGISMKSQLEFLNQTTADLDGTAQQLDELVEYWTNGDVEKLAILMNAGFSDKELYDVLLTKRNARWANWIKQRMRKPGTVFIAVGAGHLAGSVSVQNLLRAYDMEAKRINY